MDVTGIKFTGESDDTVTHDEDVHVENEPSVQHRSRFSYRRV